MSITDILIRSMCGYIFVIPAIICYLILLRKREKNLPLSRTILLFVFSYYIIGILTMTGIGKLHSFSPNLVLIPSKDLVKGTIDTILNIILFIPLGIFLPILYKKYKSIGKVTLAGFLLSLSIELVQMFGRGATDINDLITNVVGSILGYFIYKLINKLINGKADCISKSKINDNLELILLVILSFVIMITVQAWIISKFFHLG